MASSDPYIDARTGVLRNKFGLTDQKSLDQFERRMSTQRAAEAVPAGAFDLRHLRAIHRHLFQDVYDWAGEVRTVEIAKDGTQFMPLRFMSTGFADIHQRLVARRFLVGLGLEEFCHEAAVIIGDVNHVHPFREGNGRTQLLYLQQLARGAGFALNLRGLSGADWIAACAQAHLGRYQDIERLLRNAVT